MFESSSIRKLTFAALLPLALMSAGVEECNTDADGDGYTGEQGDCDDQNPNVHPDAPELCDGVDNDCDGQVDEGLEQFAWYIDQDGDGWGNSNTYVLGCASPDGFVEDGGDCNDRDPTINPGTQEVCDGKDNDCNGLVDEEVTATFYADEDGDGYGTSRPAVTGCTAPEGFATQSGDCNDGDSSINPDAEELCDGVDNNCDGSIDEGFDLPIWYRDGDGDGYGTSAATTTACAAPAGYAEVDGDCDDRNADVNPGALEQCDGRDNDCDGETDEDLQQVTWFRDLDGDGYGTETATVTDCAQPDGFVDVAGDCDDRNDAMYPGALEQCDALDNDCNGVVDDGLETYTWYRDADGDGYGTDRTVSTDCAQPVGYAINGGDCNDADAEIYPGALEVCDGVDNDCDGLIDEAYEMFTWYREVDEDGYGTASSSVESCVQPEGYAAEGGDCNDRNVNVYPGAPEVCDGVDNDCDGAVDEDLEFLTWYRDADADGYGANRPTVEDCEQPEGFSGQAGDCNDEDPAISPDAEEVCDGVDNNCNTAIDEGCE